jgi:RNA polymerase-binding transcription factor DksA
MISDVEMNSYKRQLLALNTRLDGDRSQLKDEALRATGGEASGGLSDVPLHLADLGSDAYEEEVTFGLVKNEEHLIEEINAALARLERGAFGRCEACRQRISKSRLEALPYARHCIRCAQKLHANVQK